MLGIKKRFFSYTTGPASLDPIRNAQPQPLQTTAAANQRNRQTSQQSSAHQRQKFFRSLKRQLSPNASSDRNRPLSNGAAPMPQTMSRREESDLQRAIELSLQSYEAEKSQRELGRAIEISKAASTQVADEMIRLAASGDLAPKEAKEVRLALERSLAPSIAFQVISKGCKEYENASSVSLPVSAITDESTERKSPGIDYSPIDVLISAMAEGNNRFRDWAKNHDLQIVANTAHGNNCALLSLMQHASGNYNADYREAAQAIKEELVEKFPGEVEDKGAMLDASMDSEPFQYALRKINEMFHADMDVHVIQAGHNGLPVMVEPRDPVPGKTPVVLWNSGAHFEAVIHKSAIAPHAMRS